MSAVLSKQTLFESWQFGSRRESVQGVWLNLYGQNLPWSLERAHTEMVAALVER